MRIIKDYLNRKGIMKQCIISIVVVGLLVSLPVVCLAADNSEMNDLKGHWSEEQVMKAVETGWINGYPDRTFRPENTITRAEFTKMALAADRLIPGSENASYYERGKQQYGRQYKGEEIIAINSQTQQEFIEYKQKPLTDMDSHWLTKQGWTKIALNYGMLVSEDYVYSGYRLEPDKPISRYEMAIIMDRMLGLVNPSMYNHSGENTAFTDDGNMKDWQKGYVIEACNAGVLQGYPDGSFHGERTATRAEAVTMVQNALDYMEQGIDMDITVKVFQKGSTVIPAWEHDVSSAIAQSIDGIIYIPAVRCHAVDYRDWDYADCWRTKWAPVTQGLILDREMFQYLIFAGSEEVYSKSMTQILSDQYGYSPHSLNSFTIIPPRMLYGHLMIGLKPIIRTNDNLKNSFPGYNTIFWDAELKSVSIQFREEMRPNS